MYRTAPGSNYTGLTWAAPQTLRHTQRESVGNQAGLLTGLICSHKDLPTQLRSISIYLRQLWAFTPHP